MSSALIGFIGGAIAGGANAYTKLQDEQRQFRIDQAKQEAEYARRVNLLRAAKSLETAGIDRTTGLAVTNEQAALLTPEQQANIYGPLEMKKEELAAAYGYKPSSYVDPVTKAVLSNEEARQRGPENLMSINEYTSTEQELQNQRMLIRQQEAAMNTLDRQLIMEDVRQENIEKTAAVKERARVQEIVSETNKAASVAEQKRLEKLQDSVVSGQMKVEENYRKGAEGFEPITSSPANDIEAYKMREVASRLRAIETSSSKDYQAIISKSPELAKIEGIHNLVMESLNYEEPEKYIMDMVHQINERSANPLPMEQLSKYSQKALMYGGAIGLLEFDRGSRSWVRTKN